MNTEKEYKIIPIEEYLTKNGIKDLPQEVKDEIIRVRTTLEPADFNQYKFLVEQGAVKRKQRLKKPRQLFVNDDGNGSTQFLYFNYYNQRYEVAGEFENI